MNQSVTLPLWLWVVMIVLVLGWAYVALRAAIRARLHVEPIHHHIVIGPMMLIDAACECGHPASHHAWGATNECRDCEDCWRFAPADRQEAP